MTNEQLVIAKGIARECEKQYARHGAITATIEKGSPMANLLTPTMIQAVQEMLDVLGLKTHLSQDGARLTIYREVDYLEWVAKGRPEDDRVLGFSEVASGAVH